MMYLLALVSLLVHIVVPLVLMAWLVFGKAPSIAHYMFRALFAIVFALQIAVAGAAWTWFGFWLRYVVMWGTIACVIVGGLLLLRRRVSTLKIDTWRERIDLLLSVGLFVIFATGLPKLAGRRQYEGTAVELAFPLAGENITVVHGGEGALVNIHADVKAQRYALDVVQLGAFGMRARGMMPSELDRYVIYWKPVTAPCSGEVVAMDDTRPDQTPPSADETHLAGNYVAIYCKDTTVLLAHLRPGSLKVKTGDRVALGAHVADVGNSGNTTEPHLHIHAVKGRVSDEKQLVTEGEAVPMMFPPERFLTRNDRLAVSR